MLKILDSLGRSCNDPAFDRSSAVAFLGTVTDRVLPRVYDFGNGQIEVTASSVIEWHEAEWSPDYLQDVIDVHQRAKAEEDPDERDAKNRERASRRAKTEVRRLCKAMQADTLLTLTYRANVTDIDLCKAHLKEFVRRVRRVVPGFMAVAGFEQQKRGAWHVHLATARIPVVLRPVDGSGDFRSFNVLRAIWRSVTKELGGNVDLSRRKRHNRKTAAEIAAYISKYISKAFLEGLDKGRNRWTKFGDVEAPKPVELPVCANWLETLDAVYKLVSEQHRVARMALDRWKQWFFLAAELPSKTRASPLIICSQNDS
jgi:hypothetical protein